MPYELAGIEYRTKDLITEAVQELVARVPLDQDLTGADHALIAALYEVRHPDDPGRLFYRSVNRKETAPGKFASTAGLAARPDESSKEWSEGGAFSWHKCIRDLRKLPVI